MQKCLLCNELADLTEKNELYKMFCKKCKNQIEYERSIKETGEFIIKRNKFLKNLLMSLKDVDDNLKKKPSPLKQNHNESKEPVLTQKSSTIFKGEVRQLNEKEQKSSSALECPYCKLKIDRKLYFYPLVIHNCGIACFHSKCFAKLMAEGEYKCPICQQNFFTSSNESEVNHFSDDDDDDDDKYF